MSEVRLSPTMRTSCSAGSPMAAKAASKMPGEVIDCTAERKKQYETFRRDIAGTQFAEVEVDMDTGSYRAIPGFAHAMLNRLGVLTANAADRPPAGS